MNWKWVLVGGAGVGALYLLTRKGQLVGTPIDVICRAAWGGKPFIKNKLTPHTISKITVHHTGVQNTGNTRAIKRMKSIQAYHQAGKKWGDIAYHHIIDLNGNVYEGRPTWARGDTGTKYNTTGHYLVCLHGHYSKQKPNKKQLDSLVRVLAAASQKYGVKPSAIRGHKDYAATSCPGTSLYSKIKDGSLQRSVAKAGTWQLRELCDAAAKQRVKAIEKGLA